MLRPLFITSYVLSCFLGLASFSYAKNEDTIVRSHFDRDAAMTEISLEGKAAHDLIKAFEAGNLRPVISRAVKKDQESIECDLVFDSGKARYLCSKDGSWIYDTDVQRLFEDLPSYLSKGWQYGERTIYQNSILECTHTEIFKSPSLRQTPYYYCHTNLRSDGKMSYPRSALIGVLN